MRRITACLTAAGCLLRLAVLAHRPAPAANVSEVLIGELLLPTSFESPPRRLLSFRARSRVQKGA